MKVGVFLVVLATGEIQSDILVQWIPRNASTWDKKQKKKKKRKRRRRKKENLLKVVILFESANFDQMF